jgi:hypothetical protein
MKRRGYTGQVRNEMKAGLELLVYYEVKFFKRKFRVLHRRHVCNSSIKTVLYETCTYTYDLSTYKDSKSLCEI